jgi:hypothetical protein
MRRKERNLATTPLDPDLDLLIQVRDTTSQIQYSTAAFLSLSPPQDIILTCFLACNSNMREIRYRPNDTRMR